MKTAITTTAIDELGGLIGECLTPESARRLLKVKANAKLQTRVNALAARNSHGSLEAEERAEYRTYVSFSTFVAILKSKARQVLADSHLTAP
jgi:hypothetical protein